MTEEQVKILEEVLTLYAVIIEHEYKDNYDDKMNEFEEMVCALEDLTGLELDY